MQNDDLSGAVVGPAEDSGGDISIGAPAVSQAPKPKRGRPPGSANPNGTRIPGSGRKAGTPNKATTIGREYIIRRSSALVFLCDLAAGRKVKVADPGNAKRKIEVYPSNEDRKFAARVLAPMIVPTLRATELTGKDGAPMALTLLDFLRGLPE